MSRSERRSTASRRYLLFPHKGHVGAQGHLPAVGWEEAQSVHFTHLGRVRDRRDRHGRHHGGLHDLHGPCAHSHTMVSPAKPCSKPAAQHNDASLDLRSSFHTRRNKSRHDFGRVGAEDGKQASEWADVDSPKPTAEATSISVRPESAVNGVVCGEIAAYWSNEANHSG